MIFYISFSINFLISTYCDLCVTNIICGEILRSIIFSNRSIIFSNMSIVFSNRNTLLGNRNTAPISEYRCAISINSSIRNFFTCSRLVSAVDRHTISISKNCCTVSVSSNGFIRINIWMITSDKHRGCNKYAYDLLIFTSKKLHTSSSLLPFNNCIFFHRITKVPVPASSGLRNKRRR